MYCTVKYREQTTPDYSSESVKYCEFVQNLSLSSQDVVLLYTNISHQVNINNDIYLTMLKALSKDVS